MKKTYENDAISPKKVYNILLVGFAILMIGWLIRHGPPSSANPQNGTIPPNQDVNSVQLLSARIRWYEMRNGETRLSVERIDNETWQFREPSDEIINNNLAEYGAEVIASFLASTEVRELVQCGANDQLLQYGLALSPQYIISFGIENMDNNVNNSGAEQPFTLYIGDLNPSQQYYYMIFVDETNPQRLCQQGEWVYQMPALFVDTLAEVMFNRLRTDALPPSTDIGTPEASP